MLLAIDIGNTNIVLGVFDGVTLLESWRLSTMREPGMLTMSMRIIWALNAPFSRRLSPQQYANEQDQEADRDADHESEHHEIEQRVRRPGSADRKPAGSQAPYTVLAFSRKICWRCVSLILIGSACAGSSKSQCG